ncbi:MATE family efflux transporter, partial [Duncaniella muris]|uniref:MATE family efflux transporter n=1 Tax=Duncaniella muris TaxID=2094150 RepID=UPI00263B0FB6
DGLAFTAEALTGRFAGARDFPMLHRSRNALLWWSAAMAAVFFLIYFFASDPIVALITDSPTVRADIRNYHLWLSLIPPLTVAAFIFDGFYIGLTATRAMLVATVISALIFFGICFIHADGIALPDNGRLWTAFLVYLAGRGAILAAISPRVFSPSYITASDKTA